MNYLITGATGLIGSHILFDLLKRGATITLLVRSTSSLTAIERVHELLLSPDLPAYLINSTLSEKMARIKVIEGDLNDINLVNKLASVNNDNTIVIHSGASTNLFQDTNAEDDVRLNNFNGTINLAKAVDCCKQFVFVSTAYSYGMQQEQIFNEYKVVDNSLFRNAYEKYKNQVEGWLINFFNEQLKIVRPSIVVGRLMDNPTYVTSKFDVIYGWGKFFYKLKNKVNEQGIRVQVGTDNDINIISVDYFVQVMFQFLETSSKPCLNIVNPNTINARVLLTTILNILGIVNYKFVSERPVKFNQIEKIYYNSVDIAFGPYLSTRKVVYNTSYLESLTPSNSNHYIKSNLKGLFSFAMDRNFVDGYISPIEKSIAI